MERQITIHKKKKKSLFFLSLELLQIMSAVSDSYPSVLSLHILLGAVFPYPGSCTIAKNWQLCTSWELTDKLNIQHDPPPPTTTTTTSPSISVACFCGCVYRNSCPAVTAARRSPRQHLQRPSAQGQPAALRSSPKTAEVCQAFWLHITADRINRITGFWLNVICSCAT